MKSNVEWKSWGEKDPLYGVAAWLGREKGGPNPWTPEEFYRLGEQDWADFLLRWQRGMASSSWEAAWKLAVGLGG